MESNNKSYRIRTEPNPGQNAKIAVKLEQDFDTIDILSLKINQENFYKYHTCNYGVVVGRVVANGGIGIPNAKVSVFIPATEETKADIQKSILYPYETTSSKNMDGIQYNVLTDDQITECHRIIGTFPSKRVILDNNIVLEIYDEYFRYTTVSNAAGDYMLFGLPLNENTIHVDLDLSDIGMLSQKPRDMYYKGYNVELFDSSSQFKKDTNLDNLAQMFRQDGIAYVYPFWGDEEEGEIAITRYDIDVAYKFETTCVFMGSVFTDGEDGAILKTCAPQKMVGQMSNLSTKQGKIEMIRKTFDGLIENFQIKGNELIDGDGVFNYQIPMNLDYIVTDEFGNFVPTDNPNKGIATRAEVRFRISMEQSDSVPRRRGYMLVPNNPQVKDNGDINVDYNFDENTSDESFVHLFWNKVYSIKSFLPRTQLKPSFKSRDYVGIKTCNEFGSSNPIPYNTLFIKKSVVFVIVCVVATVVIQVVNAINTIVTSLAKLCLGDCKPCAGRWLNWLVQGITSPIRDIANAIGCVALGDGWCDIYDYIAIPGCGYGQCGMNGITADLEKKYGVSKSSFENKDELIRDCVTTSLAEEFVVFNFDFGNDWLNGTLYFPTFNYKVVNKKKRKWLGLFGPKVVTKKTEFCGIMNESDNAAESRGPWWSRGYQYNRVYQNCSVGYTTTASNDSFIYDKTKEPNNEKNSCGSKAGQCYRQRAWKVFSEGLINQFTDKNNIDYLYYRPYALISRANVRLYTTDVILLGSINECDIDGIFPLHKFLPLTTFNLPSPLMEKSTWQDETSDSAQNESQTGYPDEIEATGVNWGFKNQFGSGSEQSGDGAGLPHMEQTPDVYGSNYYYDSQSGGLFLGIGCLKDMTNNKSCVNVQRISELGVDLDLTRETYNICKDSGGDCLSGTIIIPADGFISKDDLIEGIEARQMFATLNYNRLTTENLIEYNGRKYYKFEYLYPESFDSKLRGSFRTTNIGDDNKGDEHAYTRTNYINEYFDKYYYKFRMGDELIDANKHFYDPKHLRFPKPVNSFYFYFGLYPGKTAIEKFQQIFYSSCVADEEKNIEAMSNIDVHASVCSCGGASVPKVRFSVQVRKFTDSYDITITDEFGNVIPLTPVSPLTSTQNLTEIELIFGEDSTVPSVNFYSSKFKDGGKFTLIITDAVGNTFKTDINILVQNRVYFDAEVVDVIQGNLSGNECDGTNGCPSGTCTNTCDCVCCTDYLRKPADDNVNILKARVKLSRIASIIKKGCSLCDYELVIKRYKDIDGGLTLKTVTNSSGVITSLSITYGGVGYTISPDNISIPYGNGGMFNITGVDSNGTVTGVSLVNGGSGYSSADDVKIARLQLLISTKTESLSSICGSYTKDQDPDFSIDLYMCAGVHEITLRNKQAGKCQEDYYTTKIDIIEYTPLDLIFTSNGINGKEIYASKLKVTGSTKAQKDDWWFNFFRYLTDESNLKYYANEDGILKWYLDPKEINNTVESISEWKNALKNTFISQCDNIQQIVLGGKGHEPQYITVLFGSRYPAQNPSVEGADANDNANLFEGKNISYKTTQSSFTGDVTSLTSITTPVNNQMIPDGVALTWSRVGPPSSESCQCYTITGYIKGGYYVGVMGKVGLGMGYPTPLSSVMKTIRQAHSGAAVTLDWLYDYLVAAPGFDTLAFRNLFYFHIFDKRLKILNNYSRISAYHGNYLSPKLKSQNSENCNIYNLNGYFDIFYQNGPNVNLVNSSSSTDCNEFVVSCYNESLFNESMIEEPPSYNVGIDNNYHLCTFSSTLPAIRHIYSRNDTPFTSGTYTLSIESYDVVNDGGSCSQSNGCTTEITIPLGMNVSSKNYLVQTKVSCSGDTLQSVTNYFAYDLQIDGTSSVGAFSLFKIIYTGSNTPQNILYFSQTDIWCNHFNYPFYTRAVDADPAPNKDCDCTWSGKYITELANQTNVNYLPIVITTNPKRNVYGLIEYGSISSTERYLSGAITNITNSTDTLYYHIVHDDITNVRAFSQPLDFGNYIKINKIECSTDGTCSTSMEIEVVGRNAYVCAGYTYKIVQGTYKFALNSERDKYLVTPSDPNSAVKTGWEKYNDVWINFTKKSDEYIYPDVTNTGQTYSSGSDPMNGMLQAEDMVFDIKDKKQIVRVSVTDVNNVEFYTYTSLFKWIDTNPILTYCVGNVAIPTCNDSITEGIVIEFEYTIDGVSQLGIDFNAIATVSKNPPPFTIIPAYNKRRQGRTQAIKAGSTLADGTILESGYVGPLYVSYNGQTVEIPEVIVSNCNILYKCKIDF